MMIPDNDLIKIPAGEYTIGLSNDSLESAYRLIRNTAIKQEFISSSFPAHAVHVDEVLIKKFLTTCEEFSVFIADTGHVTEAEKEGWGWVLFKERWQKRNGVSWRAPFGSLDDERYRAHGDMPVMQVSWNDAASYTAWLSVRIGKPVRLPREAEWEVFARLGGVAGAGEFSNENGAAAAPNGFVETIHQALDAGAHVSTGLLWEWTEDWYSSYPGGMESKEYGRTYRVLRGGSAVSMPVQRTREFRLRKCPTARSPYYGFRIAIPVE
jgi:formylglycine-generating enzyme required for sulfatase activity